MDEPGVAVVVPEGAGVFVARAGEDGLRLGPAAEHGGGGGDEDSFFGGGEVDVEKAGMEAERRRPYAADVTVAGGEVVGGVHGEAVYGVVEDFQWTRSVEWRMGMPGTKWKLEATR